MQISEPETGSVLPNNQRQHRTSHAPKDVLPLRICAFQMDSISTSYISEPHWIGVRSARMHLANHPSLSRCPPLRLRTGGIEAT